MIVKSKEEIEIEFSRAISQAQELENIADELSRIARINSDSTMRLLEKSWKSPNGTAFIKKGEFVSRDLYDTADDLLKVAKSIRNTADIVYRAEKSAAKLCF